MERGGVGTSAGFLALDDQSLAEGLSALRWRLDDLLEGGPTLVVDVSGLSRFSSVTLAALLFAQRRCRARGAQVILRRPTARCSELLARIGMLDVFTVQSPIQP